MIDKGISLKSDLQAYLCKPSCFSPLVLLDDELWDENRVAVGLEAIYFVGLSLGTCKEC